MNKFATNGSSDCRHASIARWTTVICSTRLDRKLFKQDTNWLRNVNHIADLVVQLSRLLVDGKYVNGIGMLSTCEEPIT